MGAQTNMYWVGGTGDWTDLSHWVKTSGGSNTTGSFPDENFNAVIDVNSGLSNTSIITIPPGDYAVNDLTLSNTTGFKLLFNGTSSSNDVEMSIHGDLDITSQVDLDYAINNSSDNEWLFVDNAIHNIHTRNLDLQSVKFLGEGATYNLDSHLKATVQLRMYGGIWNSNGRTITAGKLLFYDDFAPPTPRLTKIFNAGTSIINCDEWKSTLAYGSLTVTGNHTIRTPKFDGSSAFENTQFSFHEIHLLEYPDNPGGGSSLVDHNNFECTDCIIENMVIEDTSRVKLAGKFTVNGELTVVNPGTSIEFSGGNERSNEVILNGLVITPKLVDCDERTVFTNVHNDYTSLLSTSGSLTLADAVLVNIQASGGANFNLSNGVLQGSSSGWSLINNPTPIDYLWFSANGVPGDWDDPTRWLLLGGGSNGCVPSIVDDVYVTSASKGNIRIPANYTAKCRNFKWTNQDGLDLKLDGTQSLKSTLKVTGDFEMQQNATITAVDDHEILFSSNTSNTITTNGAALPDINFIGDNGQWSLQYALICDQLVFEGGTLNTQNHDITTDYWLSIEDNPKHFIFGSSYLTINGEFSLAKPTVDGVTVDYGTSTIDCQKLSSKVTHLYNVKLSNSFPRTLQSYPYNFNSLILNSPYQITTQNDLTLNDLVFNVNGSTLAIDNADDFIINGGIESLASVSTPAALKSNSNGVQAEINKAAGNICAIGHISFKILMPFFQECLMHLRV